FGTDPVFAVLRQQDPDNRISQASGASGAPRLQTRRIAHGTDSHPDGIDASSIGEMELFSRQKVSDSLRKAVLICTDRAHGALYSWNAGVIIAGPAEVDGTAVRRTIAADLSMIDPAADHLYLAWPDIGDVDFGHVHASDVRYSTVWKERLREALLADERGLERALRAKGVRLA